MNEIKLEIKEEPLESIIKLENEEFETVVNENFDFFQPIVLLDRIDIFKKSCESKEKTKKLRWKLYPCTDCNETFDMRRRLKIHFLKSHFNGKTYDCHCGAVFKSKSVFQSHERVAHRRKSSTCRICKQKFSQKEALLDHWNKCHFTTHGPMPRTGPVKNMKRDKNIIRLHKPGPYTCDKCGIEVGYFSSMGAHWIKHLKPPLYKCDLCPKAYPGKFSLTNHIRIIHVKEKEFKCKECDFSAITARWLKEHMETYHEEKKECPVCKKMVLVMSRHLKRHRIVPQCEIEKVSCPTCKLLVARKNLKGHIKRVHENLKKCDQCDEAFSSRDLKNHKLRCHYDGELFECHCESVFKRRRDLLSHQNVSHVLVDINCKVCGMRFHKLASYNAHWKIKHCSTHGHKWWTIKEIQALKAEI